MEGQLLLLCHRTLINWYCAGFLRIVSSKCKVAGEGALQNAHVRNIHLSRFFHAPTISWYHFYIFLTKFHCSITSLWSFGRFNYTNPNGFLVFFMENMATISQGTDGQNGGWHTCIAGYVCFYLRGYWIRLYVHCIQKYLTSGCTAIS